VGTDVRVGADPTVRIARGEGQSTLTSSTHDVAKAGCAPRSAVYPVGAAREVAASAANGTGRPIAVRTGDMIEHRTHGARTATVPPRTKRAACVSPTVS
jgi:hypothetical protein